MPSVTLIPSTPFWEGRIPGGERNAVSWFAEWGLWQSTQVAWRFWLSSMLSFASCEPLVVENGWPVGLANSPKTFSAAGDMLPAAPWQAAQSFSFLASNKRAAPGALWVSWHDSQALRATLGYPPRLAVDCALIVLAAVACMLFVHPAR